MSLKYPTLLLFAALLLAGCSTVTSYEPKREAGPPKPADYPIYVYGEGVKVPRPFEVVGFMKVGDTTLTMFGGSFEAELETLRKQARLNGADAVQLTSVQSPEFSTPNFRVDANVIRFTDSWESVSMSEEELLAYYRTNAATLDPIEGIWSGNDRSKSRIGILKNSSRPRRDFVAFLLSTGNQSWHQGDKKMDLRRGERSGVYRGNYYEDDYQEIGLAFLLGSPPAKRFLIMISEETPPVIFTRQ